MSNELYHWKYVKREKKNGKWVYTYDTGSLKKDVKNFVNDPVGKKAKREYRLAQDSNRIATNTVSGRLMSDTEYRKAKSDANRAGSNRYVPTIEAGRKYVKDVILQEHSKIALDKAKKAYDKTAMGKLEKSASNTRHFIKEAKRTVKDKLGYDERETFDNAQKEVNETTSRKVNALFNAKNAYDYAEQYGDDSLYETRADEYSNAKASYDKAVSKRDKAKEVYYDTPIGKLAEAGEKIEAAMDFVEDLFKRKRTVSFKSTTDELSELEEFERMLNKRKKK